MEKFKIEKSLLAAMSRAKGPRVSKTNNSVQVVRSNDHGLRVYWRKSVSGMNKAGITMQAGPGGSPSSALENQGFPATFPYAR